VKASKDTRAQWLIDATGSKRVSSATAFLNSQVMTPEGYGVNGHKSYRPAKYEECHQSLYSQFAYTVSPGQPDIALL
jgi:hypothetical protein